MKQKIKYKIKNLGHIRNAEINLNKMNVVSGINGSGKSLSARFLFAIATALSLDAKRIGNTEIKNCVGELHDDYPNCLNNNLMDVWKDDSDAYLYLNNYYKYLKEKLNKNDEHLIKIKKAIDAHKNQNRYTSWILNYLLENEFGLDELENLKFSEISFSENTCTLNISNFKITSNFNQKFTNAIFIDSMAFMNYYQNHIPYHYTLLKQYLSCRNPNNINRDNKKYLNSVYDKFDSMIGGNFEFDYITSFNTCGNSMDLTNTSGGYKLIGILQNLILNNQLCSDSLLILDNPDTELHPLFQVQLSEILVEMVKDLGITVYINSNSPFIVEAIEVYSQNKRIGDYTDFYLTESVGDNLFDFNQIDKDDLKILYDNLSNPFRTINNIRFENELNVLE